MNLPKYSRPKDSAPKAKGAVALRALQRRFQNLKIESLIQLEEKNREVQLIVDEEAMEEAGKLDGCYVLKTDLPAQPISPGVSA